MRRVRAPGNLGTGNWQLPPGHPACSSAVCRLRAPTRRSGSSNVRPQLPFLRRHAGYLARHQRMGFPWFLVVLGAVPVSFAASRLGGLFSLSPSRKRRERTSREAAKPQRGKGRLGESGTVFAGERGCHGKGSRPLIQLLRVVREGMRFACGPGSTRAAIAGWTETGTPLGLSVFAKQTGGTSGVAREGRLELNTPFSRIEHRRKAPTLGTAPHT